MGIQTALGCLSRIVGPTMATQLFDAEPVDDSHYHRGYYVFLTTAGVLMVGIMLMMATWRRLVGYHDRR